jgi:hypothetical protein
MAVELVGSVMTNHKFNRAKTGRQKNGSILLRHFGVVIFFVASFEVVILNPGEAGVKDLTSD